jgi:hypothetical protein
MLLVTDLQTFYIPPAGIHPSAYRHDYGLSDYSGIHHEGCSYLASYPLVEHKKPHSKKLWGL